MEGSLFWNTGICQFTKFFYASLFLMMFFFFFFVCFVLRPFFISKDWFILIAEIENFVNDTIKSQLGILNGQQFLLFFKTVFYIVLLSNLSGIIPFSFVLSSHIFWTFSLSMLVWFFITILGFSLHGLRFFYVLVPANTGLLLLLLLVPIELVSYIARCFSLSIRLFANMMAGHTLLYILAGFCLKIFLAGFVGIAFFPFLVVFLVMGLEMGIAFLQAYVFLVLCCIYIRDAYNPVH